MALIMDAITITCPLYIGSHYRQRCYCSRLTKRLIRVFAKAHTFLGSRCICLFLQKVYSLHGVGDEQLKQSEREKGGTEESRAVWGVGGVRGRENELAFKEGYCEGQ